MASGQFRSGLKGLRGRLGGRVRRGADVRGADNWRLGGRRRCDGALGRAAIPRGARAGQRPSRERAAQRRGCTKRTGQVAALGLGRIGRPRHRGGLGTHALHDPAQPERGQHRRADRPVREEPRAAQGRRKPDLTEPRRQAGSAARHASRVAGLSRAGGGRSRESGPRATPQPAEPWRKRLSQAPAPTRRTRRRRSPRSRPEGGTARRLPQAT